MSKSRIHRQWSVDSLQVDVEFAGASLANVLLHSGAVVAKLKIEQIPDDGVVVAISDQGQGIPDRVLDHSSRTKAVGVDITGMRERGRQLGGRMEIESSPSGTDVKATVPTAIFQPLCFQQPHKWRVEMCC
jgi:two-component system, NarL family, sensor kinase